MAKKKKQEKQAERAEREAAAKAAAEKAAAEAAAAKAAAEAEAARLRAELLHGTPPVPFKKSLAIKARKVRAEARKTGELEVKKDKFVYVPEAAPEPVAPAVPLAAVDERPAPKKFAARLLLGPAAKANSKFDDSRQMAAGRRPLV